jgi:transmembrane sensor
MTVGKLHIASTNDPVRHTAAAWFARMRADDVCERERMEFQRWLAEEPRHRRVYEHLEMLWSDFGTHAGTPQIAARLHAIPVRRFPAARQHSQRRHIAAWSVAASLLIAALVTGWVFWSVRQPTSNLYTTATGERRTLVLQDGSHVTLDTDTQLSVAFSPRTRQLTLIHGRAFFHVAKDPDRPFLVTTPDGIVRATGTQFSVYEHNGAVEVTLVEGHVIVTPHNHANHHGDAIAMRAGQRLLMGKDYPAPRLESAQTNTDTAWLSGKLVFDDAPLTLAIAEFNRYTTDKIVIGDDSLRSIHVTGVFRTDDNRGFIDALKISYGLLGIEHGTNTVVLVDGQRK